MVDAYPGRKFEGKITTIEPQINTDTRNIRVQATIANPDHILKPGMFTTTTVVLPDKRRSSPFRKPRSITRSMAIQST